MDWDVIINMIFALTIIVTVLTFGTIAGNRSRQHSWNGLRLKRALRRPKLHRRRSQPMCSLTLKTVCACWNASPPIHRPISRSRSKACAAKNWRRTDAIGSHSPRNVHRRRGAHLELQIEQAKKGQAAKPLSSRWKTVCACWNIATDPSTNISQQIESLRDIKADGEKVT